MKHRFSSLTTLFWGRTVKVLGKESVLLLDTFYKIMIDLIQNDIKKIYLIKTSLSNTKNSALYRGV